MKNNYGMYLKLVLLAMALPFVFGCEGTSALTFLFDEGSGIDGGATALLSGATVGAGEGGTELATLHQPEPASMLLLSSGLAALTYFRSKIGR